MREGYSLTTSVSIRLLPGLGEDMVAAAAPGAPGGLSAPPPRTGDARHRGERGGAGLRAAGTPPPPPLSPLSPPPPSSCGAAGGAAAAARAPPPRRLALPQPRAPLRSSPLPEPLSGPLTSPAVTSPPRTMVIGCAGNAAPAPRHAGNCSAAERVTVVCGGGGGEVLEGPRVRDPGGAHSVGVPHPAGRWRGGGVGQCHLGEATIEPKHPPNTPRITKQAHGRWPGLAARVTVPLFRCDTGQAFPRCLSLPNRTREAPASAPEVTAGRVTMALNGCLSSRWGSGVASPRPGRTSCIPDLSITPKICPNASSPLPPQKKV